MRVMNYKAGDIIHKTGDIADTLELIITGKVEVRFSSFSFQMKKGSILGLLENAGNPYSYDYVALQDTVLGIYQYTRFSDVDSIVDDNFATCDVLVTASASMVLSLSSKYRQLHKYSDIFYKTIQKYYSKYKDLCSTGNIEVKSFPFLETTECYTPERDMPDWVSDYYDQLDIMPRDVKLDFYSTHTSLSTAAIWEASSHARIFLSLCAAVSAYSNDIIDKYFRSSRGDLFDLYINLLYHSSVGGDVRLFTDINDTLADLIEALEAIPIIPEDILNARIQACLETSSKIILDNADSIPETPKENDSSPLKNSLDTILAYASLDESEEERFRASFQLYKNLNDKNSADDNVRALRQEITKSFFDIYEAALISSFESAKTPVVLMMFFLFGYMDENLIGMETATKLYDTVKDYKPSGGNIFTAYEWLKAIYDGKIEPSKNELDQDYPAFLKAQKASGYITAEMETRYLASKKERLRFEIQNFFKLGMKITTGRPSTFCPILSEHNVIKPLLSIMATAASVENNWNALKAVDFSCFYRECTFQAPDYHITRDVIKLEVMPYVILMPTIGSRGLCWQETSDVRRDSPGRMALPVFPNEDMFSIQLQLAGEFRWEMCKKVQGARWNDITEHSLTSDYFDYLQFYRKNQELSAEAKEKIKNEIAGCKNNFKNVFIQDYINYVRYESVGSPRLNKYIKNILFTHCPFSKSIRDNLKNNPMYAQMIARHESISEKKCKLIATRYEKYHNAAMQPPLPYEILHYIEYFKM